MASKLFIFLFAITLLCCNESAKDKLYANSISSSRDTLNKDYEAILKEREKATSEKQTDNLGTLLKTISFNVKTNDKKNFEDGIISSVSIEKPEDDISQLIDGNKIVISESKVTIIIDYPLTNEYKFILESNNGFTRVQLLREISKNYYKIYKEEENSATIKTIPIDQRTTMYNRNQTNGKYGIWGHDIADLVLTEILVYKNLKGEIVLSLNIES